MKITAYEVRPDEKHYLMDEAKKANVEIQLVSSPLTMKTIDKLEGSEGVTILGDSKIDRPMLEELKNRGIKVVATRTIGTDHMDFEAAAEFGIQLCKGYYDPDGVAEYTVMLMLMALRNYKAALFRANANDYSLGGLQGMELRNLTVGVVGTGKIGMKVIEILSGFGCRVLAYNRSRKDNLPSYATYVELDQLYKESDIISLHVPLTDETRYMINEDSLKKMKKGVILVNCARGELMNNEAIIAGIESQKIGALGLDVIEEEAGIYHVDLRSDILANRNMAYIRQFPNVTMTQHIAFYTKEAVHSMAKSGIDNVVKALGAKY